MSYVWVQYYVGEKDYIPYECWVCRGLYQTRNSNLIVGVLNVNNDTCKECSILIQATCVFLVFRCKTWHQYLFLGTLSKPIFSSCFNNILLCDYKWISGLCNCHWKGKRVCSLCLWSVTRNEMNIYTTGSRYWAWLFRNQL